MPRAKQAAPTPSPVSGRAPSRSATSPPRPDHRRPDLLRPTDLLDLQRSAGNTAAATTVQRYDAFEHAGQGDHAPGSQRVKIGAQTLTSGEINALADLYGRPDDLMKADPTELHDLVGLVRRQVAGGAVQEWEWDKASHGRYNALNLKNAPHFSPRNAALIPPVPGSAVPTGDNLSSFTKYYSDTVALIEAQVGETDAGKKQQLSDQAVVTAGFAEHFLMDAFSAGHLFNKDDFTATLKAHLDALTAGQLSTLFESIANGVVADRKSEELLDTYETVDRHWGFHPNFSRPAAFKGLLEGLYKDPDGKQAVYSGLVKVVHDELSTRSDASGGIGVPVANAHGDTWTLSGDRALKYSPDTQKYIDASIVQFRTLVAGYKNAPRSLPSPTVDIAKVTDWFPKATGSSETLIAGLVQKVTDAGPGTVAALVSILKQELPSILDALEGRKMIRRS